MPDPSKYARNGTLEHCRWEREHAATLGNRRCLRRLDTELAQPTRSSTRFLPKSNGNVSSQRRTRECQQRYSQEPQLKTTQMFLRGRVDKRTRSATQGPICQ